MPVAEILSQEEIDALLAALSSGEISAEELKKEEQTKKVRIYDFRRPNKFSKEQINTFRVIYENYSRLLSTYLSAQLRSTVQVSVLSVEQMTYEEFIRSLYDPSIIVIYAMDPLEGNAIMEIQPMIAFGILDRLLGGPGRALGKPRPLTDIERTIIEQTSQRMLDLTREAWENVARLEPKVEFIESNPQFAQIVSPMEMVILISLDVRMRNELEGIINFCIPYIVLEPIIDRLSVHYWFSRTAKEQDPENLRVLKRRIKEAQVQLRVVLGRTSLTIKELLDLQIGDVVPLERKVDEDLDVYVGDCLKFWAKPGTLNRHLAVQITGMVEKGGESAD